MYLGGNPAPKTLLETPTTVPVLNIVLIPDLEWSPIVNPTNMEPLLTSSPLIVTRTLP